MGVAAAEVVEVAAFVVVAAVEGKELRVRMQVFLVAGMVVAPKIFFALQHIAAALVVDEGVGEELDVGVMNAAGDAVGESVDAADAAAYVVEGVEGVEGDAVDVGVQNVRIVVPDFDVDEGFLVAEPVYAVKDRVDVLGDRASFEDCKGVDLAHMQIGH